MSFKRKNTKPIRVSEPISAYDGHQDNLSPIGMASALTPQEMANLQHFGRPELFHQQFAAKPPRIPCNDIPAHIPGFPFAHTPRYTNPPMRMDLNHTHIDQGAAPPPWQVSLALSGASQDLPTMVGHPSGGSLYKWHHSNAKDISGPSDPPPPPPPPTTNHNSTPEVDNFQMPEQPRKWKFSSMSPDGNSPNLPPCQENDKPTQPKKSRKIKFKFQNKAPADVKYKCDMCVYCTNRSDHYKRHLMTHSEDKPLKCSTCGYGTGRSDHFRRHLSRHGLNKDEILVQCELNGIKTCSNHQRSSSVPTSHKASSQHSAPQNCENSRSLECRGPQPTGVSKKYRCLLCGYGTDRSSHYHRHLKTHSDDHPFACDKCGRKFKLDTYLKKHRCSLRPLADEQSPPALPHGVANAAAAAKVSEISVQSDEPPAQPICTGCGMWFSRFTDLTNHICPHLIHM